MLTAMQEFDLPLPVPTNTAATGATTSASAEEGGGDGAVTDIRGLGGLAESRLSGVVDELVAAAMQELDADADHRLSYEEFRGWEVSD
jgi:hypothetical protein